MTGKLQGGAMRSHRRGAPEKPSVEGRELERAMRASGWTIPETVDEVAKAEKEMESMDVSRPTSFIDPLALLKKGMRLRYLGSVSASDDDEVIESLGRAAREGGVISPTIEQRMKEDRDRAEAKKRK